MLIAIKQDFWIVPDKGDPHHLKCGDVAVTRAPGHYSVVATPDTMPEIVIHPGQDCRDLEGNSLLAELTHGVRTWGNDANGDCVFIVGAYEHLSTVSDRLTKMLPPVISLKSSDWDSPLVPFLVNEVVKDEEGQAAVLDRLLDLLLTSVLKSWLAKRDKAHPEWWQSQGDPIVEHALRLMQEDPSRAWTIEALASAVNTSRASLARRFNDIVGEPPMSFLKNWRMAIAADLLTRPEETVGTVAEKIGYRSPFAFSAAFKRMRGISPYEHRALAKEGALEVS